MNTQEILDEISNIESELQQAKSEKDRLLGRKESILQSLKDTHGISTMAMAKKRVFTLEKEITKLTNNIEASFKEVQAIRQGEELLD